MSERPSEDAIRRAERRLRAATDNSLGERWEQSQCYGAAEALRWVLGEGPPATGLIPRKAEVSRG